MRNQAEIINKVEREYSLDFESVEQLFDGPDNFYWKAVIATGEEYAIRLSKRDPATGVAFEAEWIKYLSNRGLAVPAVLSTQEGQVCSALPVGTITVFEFISGRELVTDENTPAPLAAVVSAGATLARLHNLSRGHKIDEPRPRNIFSELERVERKVEEVVRVVPGGDDLVRQVQEYLDWGRNQSFQPVLIHNDYHLGNIIFDEEYEVKALLDFDWACPGPAVKDLGHALALWSLPGKATNYYAEVFDNFLGGYNLAAEQKIEHNAELEQWLRFACLSDVCTWIVDRLEEGTPKPVTSCYNYRRFEYFNDR